jgi:hypothetical protein
MKKPEKISNLEVHEPTSSSPKCSADGPGYWQTAFLSLILILFLSSLLFASDQQSLKSARRASPEAGAGDAPAEVGGGELYALVVGISRYKHPKIPQLKVSDKDAGDFADFLKTQNRLFRNLHITLLQNEEATRTEVEKHLYYKLRRAGKDDTVVLFLSGHGADDPNTPGEFFFLTYEAEPDYLAATSVHMNRQWFLSKLDSRKVVMIADACHAGGFSKQGAKSLEPALQNFVQQFRESEGRVFLTSSRPDESSMEKPGMQNSVFTHYLLQGLRGEADTDHNGVVTLEELYNYVYNKTKNETNGYQRPQMEGRIVGLFPMGLHDLSAWMGAMSNKESQELLRTKAELEKLRKTQDTSAELSRIKAELERLKKEHKPAAILSGGQQAKPERERTRAEPSKQRPSPQREQVRQQTESSGRGLSNKEESGSIIQKDSGIDRRSTGGRWGNMNRAWE